MITLKEALARTLRSGAASPNSDANASSDRAPTHNQRRLPVPAIPAEHVAPVDAAGEAEPTAAPPDASEAAKEAEAFAALALRDRVVIMLLFDQIVTEKQVVEVWALWQQEYRGDLKTSLWRLLTLVPELDREMILAEAARVYGIEEVCLSSRAILPVLKNLAKHVPAPVWEKMMALRVLPLTETVQKYSHRKQLVFVSHDPTHPEVKDLLEELGVDAFELRYAPEHEIIGVMAEAFPREFRALKKELDNERKRFVEMRKKRPSIGDVPFDADRAAQAPAGFSEASPEAPLLNTSSVITYFEELLVGAVRSGASGVCLVPNANEKTEVYALVDDALTQWCLIDHIAPDLLFSTLKSAIIRTDISSEVGNKNQVIERWIDGALVRFRISALPFGTTLDREAFVFRVVQ